MGNGTSAEAAGVVRKLVRDLREPLHTLSSLADLLDMRAASLDGSLRVQTTGFRDAIHHIDWLLSEAVFLTQEFHARPVTMNLCTTLDAAVLELEDRIQAPIKIDGKSPEACVLYADPNLISRFFKSAVHMADQLALPDQPLVMRARNTTLHEQPAIVLEIEAATAHTLAADFMNIETSEEDTPLAGFGFAIANCRRILNAHAASVEFVDLRDSRLRFRVFFPVLTPEQWTCMIP